MGSVLLTLLGILCIALLFYGVNAMAMYGAFIRGMPAVIGSVVYADRSVNVFLRVDGHVHGAEVIEVVMNKQQAERCGASSPDNFDLTETDWPLCPGDRVSFVPFASIPPREHTVGKEEGFGLGHFILWCGRSRLRHGPPQLIQIPCMCSLDEPPRIGVRYRYRVGALMAEEYVGIQTGE
jgi:hypothetical protein